MPRIPDASALGERRIASARGPIVEDRSADILNEGVQRAGDITRDALDRYQQHDDQFNAARARSALLSADVALRKSFENDPDWATQEKRYADGMTKARESASALIRGARSKSLFEMDSQADIERGTGEIRQQATAAEGRWARKALTETLQTNRVAALEAKDPATREGFVRSTQSAIAGALDSNYITPEQAADVELRWASDYGESRIGMLPAAEALKALQDPNDRDSRFIDPAKRAQLIQVAEANISKERIGAQTEAVLATFAADSKAGERALENLSESGLSDTEQREVRSGVREGLGLLHSERRRQYAEQVNTLERSISSGSPEADAERQASALYRRGVYTPEQYTGVLQSIDTARAKAAADNSTIENIQEAITSGARLDPRDTDVVKGVDKWFIQATKLANIAPGSDEWVNNASAIAARTNILPPEAMSWARKTILSGEPALAVPAANAMSRWADAAPAAYAFFDDPNLKANAEQIDGLVRAGVKPEKAVEIARANTYDIPKARKDALQATYTKEKYAGDNADILQKAMNSDDNFDRALLSGAPGPSLAMRDEYGSLVRTYFDYTNGDINRARDLAWKDIRGTYGYSTVNGEPEVLKYAPELVFPGIDPKVIRADVEAAVGAKTWDGYPPIENADGSFSTRLTATVTDPKLNGGKPTNIPTIWKGKKLSEEEAVSAAAASGLKWPSFGSIDTAVTAAKKLSDDIGKQEIDPKSVRLVPSRETGDTHGLIWQLQATDQDGNAEVLLDAKNRPLMYAIPTDTATYVKVQEEAKRKAVDEARAESAKRRKTAEAIADFDPLKNELLQ